MLVVLFTFVGNIIYAFEFDPTAGDDAGRVKTVLDAWWMMLVTMMTVGYGGDKPPT